MLRGPAVDLLAQAPDEHVDRAIAVGLAPAPDLLEELVACRDAARLERKRVDQLELRRGQLRTRPVDVCLHLAGVDPQLLELDRVATLSCAGWAPRRAAAWTRATSSFIEKGLTR